MATIATEKYRIPLFDGSNFDNWKFRLQILLEENEVADSLEGMPGSYEVLQTDKPAVKAEKERNIQIFMKKDRKCKSIITQLIADSHLEYVKDKSSAKEMWCSLKNTFERKGIASQLYLRKQLLQLKLQEGSPLDAHLLIFDNLIRNLKGSGAKLEELDIICHLLLTLPKSYEMVVTALETLGNDLTLETVKGRLLDEETKRQAKSSKVTDTSAAFSSQNDRNLYGRSNFPFKCYGCGAIGHKRSECQKPSTNINKSSYKKKTFKENKFRKAGSANSTESNDTNDNSDGIVFLAEDDNRTKRSSVWYIDSGATDHMTNNETLFYKSWNLPDQVHISVAKSGQSIVAKRAGIIKGYVKVNGILQECTIGNVLYVPNLKCNLFSVRRLELNGLKVIFQNNTAVIQSGNKVIAVAERRHKLYELDILVENDCAVQVESSCLKEKDLWHKRYGHIS